MKKIKITSEQYNRILLKEKEERLSCSDVMVNENFNQPELLEEGLKEVLLGVALLMGVNLSGQNREMADLALQNDSIMAQIKTTLEDENKTKDLAKAFAEKGMDNPELRLAQNAEKIADAYNEIALDNDIKYKVSDRVVTNLVALDRALSQGYALRKAEMSTDTLKGVTQESYIIIKDTIEIELGNDNLFLTAGFELSESGISLIQTAIDEIKAKGGKIISAYIESSTDAETISKFKTDYDESGNITLASLRTKSVSELLSSANGDINITHREIPNNGSDVVSSKDFDSVRDNKAELQKLRDKTSKFRYVKIKLVVEFQQKVPETNPAPELIVKNYRFELTRVVTTKDTGKVLKRKNGFHFDNKKISCKTRTNPQIRVAECFTFKD
jgi:hypothetical protein